MQRFYRTAKEISQLNTGGPAESGHSDFSVTRPRRAKK